MLIVLGVVLSVQTDALLVGNSQIHVMTKERNDKGLNNTKRTLQSRRKFASVATTSLDGMCIQGRMLPRVLVLGAQKAATTSMASHLMKEGVTTKSRHKENHFFDRMDWNTSLEEQIATTQRTWMMETPFCANSTAGSVRSEVLGDYTPVNIRMVPADAGTTLTGNSYGDQWWAHAMQDNTTQPDVNLPELLHHLYGEHLSNVSLVLMLRNPLARMQSAWYHAAAGNFKKVCLDCRANDFETALRSTLNQAQQNPPVYADWLWTSLYAENLKVWLKYFNKSSVYVVPFVRYVTGGGPSICEALSAQHQFTMDCNGWYDPSPVNHFAHPSLSMDVSPETRVDFAKVMGPHEDHLIQLLADIQMAGGTLLDYTGAVGNEVDIENWLEANWCGR